ncbi:hypothetical protein, partial [Nonomuraea rhizosphaerae]|uniref:hypothetical protein n=1 Tax=Nonomuraea rhizosphaerae TaxID=2665663 RepID=UPI001C6056A8
MYADTSAMLTDAEATRQHAEGYAGALEPVHALLRQPSWGDDDLTGSFLEEYEQAVATAIEAYGLMAGTWDEVGLGIGDMAATTAAADEA